MHPSFQLSHEELLLLLSLLRLPPPLALGPQPAAGYDAPGLRAALASAAGGLVARELLQPGADPAAPPAPAPGLAELVSAVALAEAGLVVAGRRGERRSLSHIALRPGPPVLHTSPRPRVHRVAALGGPEAAVDHALAGLAPAAPGEPALGFSLPAPALDAALSAAEGGDGAAVRGHLLAAGLAEPVAAAFLRRAGPAPARYALAALRDLRAPRPAARSAVIIQGAAETWWGAPAGDGSDSLRLRGIDPAALRANVAGLVRWAL